MSGAQAVANALVAETPLTFPDLLTLLHRVRFTGQITFHFAEGLATTAALDPAPIRKRLDRIGESRADCQRTA